MCQTLAVGSSPNGSALYSNTSSQEEPGHASAVLVLDLPRKRWKRKGLRDCVAAWWVALDWVMVCVLQLTLACFRRVVAHFLARGSWTFWPLGDGLLVAC